MTDLSRLRELAARAEAPHDSDMHDVSQILKNRAFIAAANPVVVAALCDIAEAAQGALALYGDSHMQMCDVWAGATDCDCGFDSLAGALARLEET